MALTHNNQATYLSGKSRFESPYNRDANDTATLDYEETILGHLVLEENFPFLHALEYLQAEAIQEHRGWRDNLEITNYVKYASIGIGGVALVAGGFGAIAGIAGLALGGIPLASSFWIEGIGNRVIKFRETEARVLKHHPRIMDFMAYCIENGAQPDEMIAIYDRMIKHCTMSGIPSNLEDVVFLLQPSTEPVPRIEQQQQQQQTTEQKPVGLLARRRAEKQKEVAGDYTSLRDIPFDPLPRNAPAPVTASTQPQTVVFNPTEKAEIDVPSMIANEPYSYAIMAPSGGGKGMLVSNTIRLLKQVHPEIHIFLADPKDDPKERGYWEGAVDTWVRCNFLEMGAEAKSEFIESALARYQAVQGAKLLIFDEATNVFGHLVNRDRKLLGELKSFLSGIASSGNSRKNYVWLVGHSGNLGDYGISGGQMSCFRKIYIAPTTNKEAIQQLGNTTFCGDKFGEDGLKNIFSIANQSPVNRAVYLGVRGEWLPMAKLTNHSGYDRDADSMVGGGNVASSQTTTAEQLQIVGHGLWLKLKAAADSQSDNSAVKSVLLKQRQLHAEGKFIEAIACMLPHVCPTPQAFIAMFGQGLAHVYDRAMGFATVR